MKSVDLHYRIIGEGKPVFILHGLFGSSRNWLSAAKELANTFQIILVDLRNHGESPHCDTMDYPGMAQDVFTLANKLSIKHFSVIGHSMGGKTAMQMALSKPGSVGNLIILDISPIAYEHRYGKLFHAMNSLPLHTLKNRNDAGKLLCPEVDDDRLCQFLLQNLVRSGNEYHWRLNLPVLEKTIGDISGFPVIEPQITFTKPCLFLGGRESDFITDKHIPEIKKYFPAAKVRWVENAGHLLHVEQPETVLKTISNFILA